MAGEKIVYVDDEPGIISVMSRRLRSVGYQIFAEENAITAIELIRSERPDLIILDQMMPDMDGLETCKTLKADPALKNIPIIIYTACNRKRLERDFFEAGATGLIYKPDVAGLLELIKCVFDGETVDWESDEDDD